MAQMPDAKRLTIHGTVKAQGDKTEDAPYGWVEGIANANTVDRYDELVLPSALSAAVPKFLQNPVMSFGHNIEGNPVNGSLPAGRILSLTQDAKGDTHFRARWANTPDAQLVRGLYKDGDMRGFSIQFITLDSRHPAPEELAKYPTLRRVITELDLIEIACAVVPVNAGSLATAAKSLASVRKLAATAEGKPMDKRKLSDDEMKQMDSLVATYNTTAESMGNIALALDDLRAKAGEEDDHSPRVAKMVDGHKALGESVKGMGEAVGVLAKGFGIKAEGDKPAEEPAEGEDDATDEDPEDQPEEQAKKFEQAFQKALTA